MDHDKQVTDLVQQGTRDKFLNQPLHRDETDTGSFNLEIEFAKSAKNRSVLIPAAVATFLVLLGLGAWIASQFTEQASQKSSVSIGSFEDLKLKEIFDTARKNKKDLEAVQAQIDLLTQTSATKVAALQQTGASKADIASVNDASGAQAKAILADTARQVAVEKASLASALRPLKAQAEGIQKKIDTYDDRIGQLNKKNQQVLDSQQRLFDLQKQKLTEEYDVRLQTQVDAASATVARLKKERDDLVSALKARQADEIRKLILKYNPVIVDPVLSAQLTALGTKAAAYPALTLPDRIAAKNLLSNDLQTSLTSRVERTQTLLARLREIPFENSVPPLLNALDNAIADSLAGYDGYLVPLASALSDQDAIIARQQDTIAQRDATIAGLRADWLAEQADRSAERERAKTELARWTGGVDEFVATFKEWDGVFIDVRDAADWLVVLKPDRAKALGAAITLAAAAPPPPTGKVVVPVNLATVRDGLNNNELGTVSVETSELGGWRARLVKLSDPKKPFKAFDRLVLSLPNKK